MGRMGGRTVLVTGGASGIGAATAAKVIAEGGNAVIADVAADGAKQLAAELGEAACAVDLDVPQPGGVGRGGGPRNAPSAVLDALVNNAGIMIPGNIEDVTLEDWQRVLDVNLNRPFLGCRAAFPALKASGSGAIVNVSSNSILQGYGIYPAYTAAKGGLDNLTRSIAAHCRMKGIPVRCNTVLPGGIDTPLAREGIRRDMGLDPDSDDPMAAGFVAMLGRPAQVADVIVFLCSPEASLVNGETVLVDGGLTRTVPIG